MKATGRQGSWRLSQVLVALLLVSTLLTFLLASALVLLWRLPGQEREHRVQVQRQAAVFAQREELLLKSIERQLALVAHVIEHDGPQHLSLHLDVAVGQDTPLQALALVGPDGRIVDVGLPLARRPHRSELIGLDVSGLRSYRLGRERQRMSWGTMGLSVLSGDTMLGAALPLPQGRMLLADVPPAMLLASALSPPDAHEAAGSEPRLWVVDGGGEVMADTDAQRAVGRVNLVGTPVFGPAGRDSFELVVDGRHYLTAVAMSPTLDWRFVARLPAGLAHPQVRDTLLLEGGGLLGTLVIGLLLAPLASRRLVGWLQDVVAHARQTAQPDSGAHWQATPVREFNLLAERLTTMTHELRQREHQTQAMFDASPVPVFVTAIGASMGESTLLAANEAWCRLFGHHRDDVLGRRLDTLNLWADPTDAANAHLRASTGDHRVALEARLCHADGSARLCLVSGQGAFFDQRWVMVWGIEDIGERRRMEQALRELNSGLEERVAQRTQDLAQANQKLRHTLSHLQQTRDELLRTGKLAALGDLVAGVAHELNTPIGNTLMAVSTLGEEAAGFRRAMTQGLRRAALEQLLDSVEMAVGISGRNLQRAADLVTSFKQVAVDQASSQRRRFVLDEAVNEIVLTLKPSFNRTPYRLEVAVDAGLGLDSYPGALGQILANLITNARLHGFDGRDHGCIRITGRGSGNGHVELSVEDDGVGIPPALLERVFDPFVTTRMGRGGTGLGLHIAHNAATRILGGSLEVRSEPGHGTRFVLRVPTLAPQAEDEADTAKADAEGGLADAAAPAPARTGD